MCGICGFISNQKISVNQLRKMNELMTHRGPDDHGEEIYTLNDGNILGMAQRRLSILDLSELGHQPMHDANDEVIVVFNGEIYNFQELKKELNEYEFKSNCDTEVIVAAYIKWGKECVNRFNGMFAIAIYDRRIDELYLYRDRFGKKPLYYWYEGNNFVFASELKPIMNFPGFEKRIQTSVIGPYLYRQYIAAPDTIFKNVYKVCAGECITYKDGKMIKKFYWRPSSVYNSRKIKRVSFKKAKKELKYLLTDAVKRRMIADVPLGCFLSGGYDSTLVAAIAQGESNTPLKTFSIGFKEGKYDESVYAREVAKYLGTNHTEYCMEEKKMLELVDEIPYYYDEPFADGSQIPSMFVSEIARKDVEVVLTGDGGDELFCGYNSYSISKKRQQIMRAAKILQNICNNRVGKALKIYKLLPNKVREYVSGKKSFNIQSDAIYYGKIIEKLLKNGDATIKYVFEEGNEKNWQLRKMLLDQETYLPDDILCKVDRATMKYSLEGRCPILDYRVAELSYTMPHIYKYCNGKKKYILKQLVYDYVPKKLMDRPKMGFSVPKDKWLKNDLRTQLLQYSKVEYLEKQGIFEPMVMHEFINDYLGEKQESINVGQVVWSYFIFQKWYDYYMENKTDDKIFNCKI